MIKKIFFGKDTGSKKLFKLQFDSLSKNFKFFNSNINNVHSFTVGLDKSIVPTPPIEILKYFVLNIRSNISLLTEGVDSLFDWTTEVSIPSISTTIDETLVLIQSAVDLFVDSTIKAPSMVAIMSLLQEMGVVELNIPFSMCQSISENYDSNVDLKMPSVDMSLDITSTQYYIVGDYDSYLLSDLD